MTTAGPRYGEPVPDTTDERSYHHGNLRTALLDAAERGLRDLAREVGVSHAAPRRHFPTRQSLLDALAEAGFTRLHTTLRTALAATTDDFPARVHATMTAYAHFATENAALLELMYTGKHSPDAPQIAKAAEAPFQLMNELIEQGQAEGALQPGDPERIGIILLATLQGIASLINGDIVKPDLLDGLVDTAVEQFLRGARPLA